jgi:DNA-directed RNA polymerase subunit RPC12/RpoP
MGFTYEPNEFDECDQSDFYDPGGRSALRAGRRIYPCPTCGKKNRLTKKDKELGYQCDECADRLEGNYSGSEY